MAKRKNAVAAKTAPATPARKGPNMRAALAAKQAAKLAPAPVQAQTQVASVATKLTKRNNTQVGTTLVFSGKQPKSRAAHVKAAWAAVQSALPATATALCALAPLAHPQCVSPQAFISYMLRRGHLMPKA